MLMLALACVGAVQAAATSGQTVQVPVHVLREPQSEDGDARTTVTLTATSEADATKTASRTCAVHVRDTTPKKK